MIGHGRRRKVKLERQSRGKDTNDLLQNRSILTGAYLEHNQTLRRWTYDQENWQEGGGRRCVKTNWGYDCSTPGRIKTSAVNVRKFCRKSDRGEKVEFTIPRGMKLDLKVNLEKGNAGSQTEKESER